ATAETSIPELARLMVGRSVIFDLEKKPQQPGEVVLSVEAVCATGAKGLPALKDVSFQVRAGEIVGLAGVAGNGQSELAEVLTGLRRCTSGHIRVHGDEL
ncbi:MAG TPA: ATP-binding cassette domain-containing protein, partial [Anaerolineales bacterium]|nr:ATP-binding cassette domain-containing protein [Anaerolineales bacterium]